VKFGIFYVGGIRHTNYKQAYDDFLKQVQYAEELGFDSVWLGEHHGSLYGTFPNPAVLAAAIARETERIRIGIAISVLPFQNPVRIAEDWAMVDVLSGGRVNFGVGRGYQPREFKMMLADQNKSREVFVEALDIILGLWNSDEPISFHGEHFDFTDIELFPKPIQKPIPVWVAAVSPSTFQLVAERGLQVLAQPGLQTLEKVRSGIVDAARTLIAHGRDPATIDFPLFSVIHLAETPELAYEEFAPTMEWYFGEINKPGIHPGQGTSTPKGYEAYAASGERMKAKPTLDGAIESGIALVTDVEGARERVRQMRDELGVKQFGCSFQTGGIPVDVAMRQMKLWASEVMPYFKDDDTPVPEAFVSEEPADAVAAG
jgi:natural product biosynthesis luciferase-like monooxygenase protein